MKRDHRKLQALLLEWYARHRRVLPWRALAGHRPDPYHVWLSEIMLQQTTVAAAGPYFIKFIKKWPTIQALAKAKTDDVLAAWAGLGYYARARNLHKCAKVVANGLEGVFPEGQEELMELPGIGPYTAAAISSIAFNCEAVAVDGNVERVVSRFFAIEEPLPLSKPLIRRKAAELAAGNRSPADFTQAFMELGATVCTPKNPKCGLCPWREACAARRKKIAEDMPRRQSKKKKPVRYGKVFWLHDGKGAFLIEKRAGRGLYQGMYQLPTTDWVENRKGAANMPVPFGARVTSYGMTVRHSFTHFDLVLEIWGGRYRKRPSSEGVLRVSPETMDSYALPSLMKKAVRLCAPQPLDL